MPRIVVTINRNGQKEVRKTYDPTIENPLPLSVLTDDDVTYTAELIIDSSFFYSWGPRLDGEVDPGNVKPEYHHHVLAALGLQGAKPSKHFGNQYKTTFSWSLGHNGYVLAYSRHDGGSVSDPVCSVYLEPQTLDYSPLTDMIKPLNELVPDIWAADKEKDDD